MTAEQLKGVKEERPPAKLPNGKTNPEYTRWYRQTPKGRAVVAKYAKSEKAKACRKRHWATGKGKASQQKRYRKKFPTGARTCVVCGSQYHADDVIARGWELVGYHGCICDLCEQE